MKRWLKKKLRKLETLLEKIMATLDDVLKDVTDEKTAIGGLSDLITGLRKAVADALSGVTLPPDAQAKVDAIFNEAEARKAELAAAVAANVPVQAKKP